MDTGPSGVIPLPAHDAGRTERLVPALNSVSCAPAPDAARYREATRRPPVGPSTASQYACPRETVVGGSATVVHSPARGAFSVPLPFRTPGCPLTSLYTPSTIAEA